MAKPHSGSFGSVSSQETFINHLNLNCSYPYFQLVTYAYY